jgi:hypothetical protein
VYGLSVTIKSLFSLPFDAGPSDIEIAKRRIFFLKRREPLYTEKKEEEAFESNKMSLKR